MYSTRFRKRRKKRPSAISRSAVSAIESPKGNTKRRKRDATEFETINVTRGSENVFEDLGFEEQEAANLKIRADLLLDLRRYIQKRGWTQAEAAAFFHETQPRISNLLAGEVSRFSIDKLINMLARAGMRVRVETEPQAA